MTESRTLNLDSKSILMLLLLAAVWGGVIFLC
jgi:hypothetical protein